MFTSALKSVVLTGSLLIGLLNQAAFVAAAPAPADVDPFSTNPNVPLSPEDALASYTVHMNMHGPVNNPEAGAGAEAKGGNSNVTARSNGPVKWTGGNNEVIHFFNCEKRPNWGYGSDSLVVVRNPSLLRPLVLYQLTYWLGEWRTD